MPPRKDMAIRKTIKKRKKKILPTCRKKKTSGDSELARLISEATTQAFKCKEKLENKISTHKGLNKSNKQNSPSISTDFSDQTISKTMIDDSATPSISSRDSWNDGVNNSKDKNEQISESYSSKYGDSEFDSIDNVNNEILSPNVGHTFKKGRYRIQCKLDSGAFSTVWLAWDQQDNKYVALKIQNSSKDCMKAAQEEIKIHKAVVEKPLGEEVVVKLLDHFNYITPHNRKHICMVFEYLGDNLLTLIKASKYKGLPLDIVKKLAKQILTGLNYLHKDLKIIHTDLKPENILLMSTLDPSNDPRISFEGTSMPMKRQHFLTPVPSKRQKSVKSFHVENLSNNMYQYNNQGEKLSQPTSQVGSRPTTPSLNNKNANNQHAEKNDTKMQVDEGHLTSEPESLDRLAIDSDPDIARNLVLNDKPKKTSLSGGSQHQVKFSMPCKRKKSRAVDSPDVKLNIDIRCKIVDLGTACWTNKILTNDIQTRPYRCPEVLLGCKYSTSADIWSFGCLIFELSTGSILFDPKTGGNDYNRDEDHLAQIVEILGPIPKNLVSKGIHSYDYLTKDGELKHRKPRGHCPLYKLLLNEYSFNEKDAKDLAGFLLPLLELTPNKRPSAAQCLQHPWLKNAPLK